MLLCVFCFFLFSIFFSFLFLFVMPDEIPKAVPVVGLVVDVAHAGAQAGLEVVRVVAEEVHDHAPGDGGEDGPGVPRDQGRGALARDPREALPRLHGEPGQGQDDAREDVDYDLLVHARDLARSRAAAEDEVAAHQAGEEVVVWACV